MRTKIKQIVAGTLALATAVTGVSIAHLQSARAADLTFIKTPELPVADGVATGDDLVPAYNGANFYKGADSTTVYHYAGEEFSLVKEEADNSFLFLGRNALESNDAWGSDLITSVDTLVKNKATTAEEAVARLTTIDSYNENGLGLNRESEASPKTYEQLYYPIAAGELFRYDAIDGVVSDINDPAVAKVSDVKYWTRTDAGGNGAYYVTETGQLQPADRAGHEETGAVEETDPAYKGQEHAVVPSFRMDMTKVISQLPADEDITEPGPDVYVYNPSDDGAAIKYMVVDKSANSLDSRIAGKDLNNIYENGAVLINYNSLKTGANKYVSAFIYNSEGRILYYARLADADKRRGKALLNIPSGLDAGSTYTLALFEETFNGADSTQTCSEPVYARFTLIDESEKPVDVPVVTVSAEHLLNIYKDTTGTVMYRYGGKEFRFAKTNDDYTLMFVASDARDFSDAEAWSEDTLINNLESKAMDFEIPEINAIKPVNVYYSKYNDGGYEEDSLLLFPLTKTQLNDIPANVKAQEESYWTASYRNSTNAYFVDSDGTVKTSDRTTPRYTLPAFNLNLRNVFAQVAANEGINVSTASEPGEYIRSGENGIKFIIKDAANNNLNIEKEDINVAENGNILIDYRGAVIKYDSVSSQSQGAHYIDAAIYRRGHDDIKYFGRIAKITSSNGTIDLKIPEELTTGVYDIAFIEETITEGLNTCSEPVKIRLTVEKGQDQQSHETDTEEATFDKNTDGAMAGYSSVVNSSYSEGDVITLDTTDSDEHSFIVYNAGTASIYTLMLEEEGTSIWGEGSDGSVILSATDDIEQTLTDAEKKIALETLVKTDDKNAEGQGSATKQLFVPSYTELGDELKTAILNETEIGNTDTTQEASMYWTRSYAGNNNAYIISNADYLNGDDDRNNVGYEFGFIPAANLDLAKGAILLGDAESGEYNDVSAEIPVYDVNDFAQAKPYYVAERLSLNMDGIKDTVLTNAQPGVRYTADYAGADTGENMYLSAIVYKVGSEGTAEVLNYGRLARLTKAAGTVEFIIPPMLSASEDDYYMIAFFAEEANAPYAFNYVSDPVFMKFEVGTTKLLNFCDIEVEHLTANGNDQVPRVRVIDRDKGTDVDPSSLDVKFQKLPDGEVKDTVNEPGKYKVIVKPRAGIPSGYSGEGESEFFVAIPITGFTAVISPADGYIYNGEPQVPNSVLLYDTDNNPLVRDEDYEVEFQNNINAGKAKAIITGKGKYGSDVALVKTYTINPASMDVIAEDKTVTYDGTLHTLDIRPANKAIADDPATKIDMLYNGEGFLGAYTAGEYQIEWTVTSPNYNAQTGTTTLTIEAQDASNATVTLEAQEYDYIGTEIEPVISSVTLDGNAIPVSDYDVVWEDNVKPGTAKGTITFKGNYTGERNDLTFTIKPLDLDNLEDGDLTAKPQTYTGNPITPVVKLKGLDISTLGILNTEYQDNEGTAITSIVNAGTYRIVVTPKEARYATGSKTVEFKVLPIELALADLSINSKTSVNYAGEPVVDTIESISYLPETGGEVSLTEGVDYDVAYTDNEAVGTGHASITFKGNYTSKTPIVIDFEILPGIIEVGTVTSLDDIYNGEQHKPVIECSSPEDVTVKYAVKEIKDGDERGQAPADDKFVAAIPETALINAGDYEVWFRMSKENYATLTDYTRVNINNASMEDDISITNIDVDYNAQPHPFTVENITLTGNAVGATVTYSVDGENYQTAIPDFAGEGAYTEARNYEFWCKFEKSNYDTVTRKATVTIRASEVPYVLQGNTEYTYDGNPHSVICATQAVGAKVYYATNGQYSLNVPEFTDIGTHGVQIKIICDGYEDTYIETSLKIIAADMDVDATGYSGPYDSENHGIVFDFRSPTKDKANISYSEDGITYTANAPYKVNAGRYIIYYKIEAQNYNTKSGWVEINITALDAIVTATGYDGGYDGLYHSPKLTIVSAQGIPAEFDAVFSEDNGETWSKTVPKYKEYGVYPVKWKVTERNGNYNTIEGTVTISITARTSIIIEEADLDPTLPRDEAVSNIVNNLPEDTITTVIMGSTLNGGITGRAFKDATQITRIAARNDNEFYSSRDGVLYDKLGTTVLAVPRGMNVDNDVMNDIMDGVTTIGDGAFINHSEITGTLIIPNIVTEIGSDSFRNTGLNNVTVHKDVEKIDSGAFADTKGLAGATFTTVPELGDGVFRGSGLTHAIFTKDGTAIIYVPATITADPFIIDSNAVKNIAAGAFIDNENIKEIKVLNRKIIEIDTTAIDGDVKIKVPSKSVQGMKAANPFYAPQIEGYAIDMSGATINFADESAKYKIALDGTMPTPEIGSVVFEGEELIPDTDYDTSYRYDSLKEGAVVITGKGDYEGEAVRVFNFTKTGQLIIDTSSTMDQNEFIDRGDNNKSGIYVNKSDVEERLTNSVDEETMARTETENIVIRLEYSDTATIDDAEALRQYLRDNGYDGATKIFDMKVYTEDEEGIKKYISELDAPLNFTMNIPEEYRNKANYSIATLHKGNIKELDTETDGESASFSSSEFSAYALLYENNEKADPDDPKFVATLEKDKYTYTGSPIEPPVTVKYGEDTLIKDDDYELSYEDNTEPGTAKVTVQGKDYFMLITKVLNFTIETADEGLFTATIDKTSYKYTGSAIEPEVTVKYDGTPLTKDTDYEVSYADNVNEGAATITVTGKGEYLGITKELAFVIYKIEPGLFTATLDKIQYNHTGSAITPEATVKYNGADLTKGTDYNETYSNNVNVGTATLTVTGINDYEGIERDILFEIIGSDVKTISATLPKDKYEYTGMTISPEPTVKSGDTTLAKNVDYTVSYDNNIDTGLATVTVTGMGEYEGAQAKAYFAIIKSDPKTFTATLPATKYNYTGSAITPEPTVMDGETILEKDKDYTVAYADNINIGLAIVNVHGINTYSKSVRTLNFAIVNGEAKTFTATLPATVYKHTGSAITPDPIVTSGAATLTKETDYVVTYANNVDVGLATVTVKGINEYNGQQAIVNFAITNEDPKTFIATLSGTEFEYTGKAITPEVTAKNGDITLKADTDYKVTYVNNIYPGTATAVVQGLGEYAGTVQLADFEIVETVPTEKEFVATINKGPYYYTGYPIEPVVSVYTVEKPLYIKTSLVEGVDYTVTYVNNVEIGTATAVVTGMGEYSEHVAALDFTIAKKSPTPEPTPTPQDITTIKTTLMGSQEYEYTGKEIKPAVAVVKEAKDEEDTRKVLVLDTDYTVSYENNINTGSAKAIVNGINSYVGYRGEVTFKITPKPISSPDISVSNIDDEKKLSVTVDQSGKQTAQGTATQNPTIKFGDKTLKKGTDYKLAYKDNNKVGTATLTITGLGNYDGTLEYEYSVIADVTGTTGTATGDNKTTGDASKSSTSSTTDKEAEAKAAANKGSSGKSTVSGNAVKKTSPQTNDVSTAPVVAGILLVIIAILGVVCIRAYRKKDDV